MQRHFAIIGMIGALAAGSALAQTAPPDPAGTSTGQMQRDSVTQPTEGHAMPQDYVGPKAPAGTSTGQAQRDDVHGTVPPQTGEMKKPVGPMDPAGTSSGQTDRMHYDGKEQESKLPQ